MKVVYPATILATTPGYLERGRIVNVVLVHRHIPDPYIPRRGRQLAIPIIIRITIVINIITPRGIRCLPHRSVQQYDLAQIIPNFLTRRGIHRFGASNYDLRHGIPNVLCRRGVGILQHQ